MNRKQKISFVLFLLTLTFFTSCVSINKTRQSSRPLENTAYIPKEFIWQPVAQGIERFDFENPNIPLIYHAVKIELDSPNLELVCFPDTSTKINSKGFFNGKKTLDFAKHYNCVVAINASPFNGRLIKKKIVGAHSAKGNILAAPNNRYAALAFSKDLRAQVLETQTEDCFEQFDFVFGGFFVVLKNNEVLNSFAQIYDSRTGAGISQDGKTLYLIVVEGEYPKHSKGLTYPNCAEIFKAMGCSDALELDGGGSTQLCIDKQSVLSYKALRIQANSFGFRLLSK